MEIRSPGAVDEYRRHWVDQVVSNSQPEGAPRYTDLRRLIDGATRDAAEQAVAAGHYPTEDRKDLRGEKFDDYLHRAIDPIQDLYWSFEREGDRHDGSLWRHQPSLLQQTKDKRLPEFMRREIEGVAGTYVKSGLKTATVDRLLVDLMVAMEFSQYAETIFRAPHVPIIAPSILKRNVFLDWFTNRILAAVIGFIVYLVPWGLSKIGLFPEDWLWAVVLILVLLWLGEAVWNTVMLPKSFMVVRKAQQTINGLIHHMSNTYAALASDGPISAQHVTGLVNRSTDAGVVWPGPLHVLLEDITARGGRF